MIEMYFAVVKIGYFSGQDKDWKGHLINAIHKHKIAANNYGYSWLIVILKRSQIYVLIIYWAIIF